MTSGSDAQIAVAHLISGAGFLVVGLLTLSIAAIRRRSGGVLAVLWIGTWSAIYGIQRLSVPATLVVLLPHWLQSCVPYSYEAFTNLAYVAGTLTFRELTRGKIRQFLSVVFVVSILITFIDFGRFVLTGEQETLRRYNPLVSAGVLIVLLFVIMSPALGKKYGGLEQAGRGAIVLAGSIVFCFEMLWSNVARVMVPDFDTSVWDDVGFAALLLSLGYAAMERLYSGELRLSSIENELAVARQLQFSILPTTIPELRNLRIAAGYEPMTAVAGDFYEFLPVDLCRSGFLVADVSGHGVPAALISSMIKVAAKAVVAHASDPPELLRRLRDVLSDHLKDQFVSVAYLWVDTEARIARYSAAGHPPLLHWRAADRSFVRIENNGMLIGMPFNTDYPMCEVGFSAGDRFLLYTDGVTEPENAEGEAFGDRRLEQVLRDNSSGSAAEISLELLSQLRAWPPASTPQQDDITIVVIDVV